MPAEPEREPMPEGEEPPPRGVRAMAAARWAILGLAALLVLVVWGAWIRERVTTGAVATHAGTIDGPRYQCPMHPQIVADQPGECPICHMDLVPITPDRAGAPSVAAPSAATPLVVADAAPPGTVPITLSLDRVQSIGVRTALVEAGATTSALRVTAIVEAPEQGAAEVHVRTRGFVDAIDVDQTGTRVVAGQKLLSLYSPEILQGENELLTTRAWTGDAGTASHAARTKLELLGMTPADIDRVVARGEPLRAVSVVAPRGGFVTKKSVVLGSYVTPETVLYEIQDLSRVYVVADAFLRDLSHVSVGTRARFRASTRPDEVIEGKIDLVYPLLDAAARTRRVRMQVANGRERGLAPGEYGVVELETPSRRAVTVPRDALVDTGTATYVFVVAGEGRFVPRTVIVAGADGDRVAIAEGLEAGERVVSGATFLVDSESRLQAAIASHDQDASAKRATP